MIPDTLDYMIAGYVVIGTGIVAYLASLVIRSAKIKRKLAQNKDKHETE